MKPRIIFLISQPRAGSTLLQRILGGHPDIHTVSEPWLMLHPIYALRGTNGIRTEYSAPLAHKALRSFLTNIGGEESYLEGIRRMYGYLYKKALDETGKRYFLDKTPRYYLIIPELAKIFPEAKFIFLFRNPLAVLKSILITRAKGNWFWLSITGRKEDLLLAPKNLLHGIEILGQKCKVVHYENLVIEPEEVLKDLSSFLDVEFITDIVNYSKNIKSQWDKGDPNNVYKYDRPIANKAHDWHQSLEPPQMWRLMRDYLELLGEDVYRRIGYDYKKDICLLENKKPGSIERIFTRPLDYYLKPLSSRPILEKNFLKFLERVKILPKIPER